MLTCGVALLAEGVDRNWDEIGERLPKDVSPSSRRAWIEIPAVEQGCDTGESPSSRRAWIEIALPCKRGKGDTVALLAEGVDRNKCRHF